MLSLQDRILLVKLFYKNSESLSATLRAYGTAKNIHNTSNLPQRQTLHALITKFECSGTVEDIHRGGWSGASAEQKELVHSTISEAPSTSLRAMSHDLAMSSTTIWRILHDELRLHPYKIRVGQPLQQRPIHRP
jgi:hypothetical protein